MRNERGLLAVHTVLKIMGSLGEIKSGYAICRKRVKADNGEILCLELRDEIMRIGDVKKHRC
jgi:hypothetical protein